MDAAFRKLMAGLIDYAGLFPPAALDMPEALRLYSTYRSGADAWLLGRFICPASRLDELGELLRQSPPTTAPLPLSVILPPASTAAEALENATASARVCATFEAEHEDLAVIEAFEAKLPEAPGEELVQLFAAAADRLDSGLGRAVPVFWERSLLGDVRREELAILTAALAEANGQRAIQGRPLWGLKLRCGGLEAGDFPSVQALGLAVGLCLAAGVPFKATAGLHHPVRHHDARLGTLRHGFLNLFGGAALAAARALDEVSLLEVLADQSSSAWGFEGDRLRWRNLNAAAEDVGRARELLTSYGSCSFDEPCDDLRELGFLTSSQRSGETPS